MRPKIRATCSLASMLLLAVFFTARIPTQAAPSDNTDNPEVTRLLESVELQAADLQHDADTLVSYTRSGVSWESHADELNAMKDRINQMGQTLQKLQNMRSSASPWQQEAIDRIIPVAKKLASNTQAAIEHLNQNPKRLQDPQYQQYLQSNDEAAQQLTSMVRDFVQYGKTRSTLEALERRLEIPR